MTAVTSHQSHWDRTQNCMSMLLWNQDMLCCEILQPGDLYWYAIWLTIEQCLLLLAAAPLTQIVEIANFSDIPEVLALPTPKKSYTI